MNEKEYKKSLRQFHKHSDRHILVVETDMSFSDIQKGGELFLIRFEKQEMNWLVL